MRRNNDPSFTLDCDRCGQTYGVYLDCDHGFSRFAALAHPRLCPDCRRTAKPSRAPALPEFAREAAARALI